MVDNRDYLIVGRVFTADPANPVAEAVVVRDGSIVFVGSESDAVPMADGVHRIDAGDGLVMPGFVDGHTHIAFTGANASKVQLREASSAQEIQALVAAHAREHPNADIVGGIGWRYVALPDGKPLAALLDAVVPDRPVVLEALDLHSSWLNTAALERVGITNETADPVGGEIVRDDAGVASGHLLEAAHFAHVLPLTHAGGDSAIEQHLLDAFDVFTRAGVTTAVDMALDPATLSVLDRLQDEDRLGMRVVGHMIISPSGKLSNDLAQVAAAAELLGRYQSDMLRVTGIKLILDGTVDGCTAALREPYVNGSNGETAWSATDLDELISAADAVGLQVAVHAIGDRAIAMTLDAFEVALERNGAPSVRHRIEHLELATPDDIDRLALLGVTASMQPVHLDPLVMDYWWAMIGQERGNEAFAWPKYLAAGATLAFGTDTPTAPHEPLPNMYLAATRRSPSHPSLEPHRPEWCLPLDAALGHGTRESAYASHLEHLVGCLRVGMAADVVILSRNPLDLGNDSILETSVMITMIAGRIVHESTTRR